MPVGHGLHVHWAWLADAMLKGQFLVICHHMLKAYLSPLLFIVAFSIRINLDLR